MVLYMGSLLFALRSREKEGEPRNIHFVSFRSYSPAISDFLPYHYNCSAEQRPKKMV